MDISISVQNKLYRVFFEEDFKTIVTNSVSRLNDPSPPLIIWMGNLLNLYLVKTKHLPIMLIPSVLFIIYF